jgi:16S rRNA processing protein RimM
MSDGEILVGVVGAPHGVRGEVRLKSYTEDPMTVAGYPTLRTRHAATRRLRITAARLVKDVMLVVRFADVNDRDAAQALTNVQLFIDRADLPATGEDEFYHADLIGLSVVATDGTVLGVVASIMNHGAGDLVEVSPETGDTFLVPFTRAFVPTVDLRERRLVLSDDALSSLSDEDPEPAEHT